MRVRCDRADGCGYKDCNHHAEHDEEEECIDDVCQEHDSCIEPGDLIRVKCIPEGYTLYDI